MKCNVNPLHYLQEVSEEQYSNAVDATYKKLRDDGKTDEEAKKLLKKRMRDFKKHSMKRLKRTGNTKQYSMNTSARVFGKQSAFKKIADNGFKPTETKKPSETVVRKVINAVKRNPKKSMAGAIALTASGTLAYLMSKDKEQ